MRKPSRHFPNRLPTINSWTDILIFSLRETLSRCTAAQLRIIAETVSLWADQAEERGDY